MKLYIKPTAAAMTKALACRRKKQNLHMVCHHLLCYPYCSCAVVPLEYCLYEHSLWALEVLSCLALEVFSRLMTTLALVLLADVLLIDF
mmetsp:Transcript_8188/g.12691  ORF Transcript_8188/g.12691 Transcript_8188/m.12691 type:complete len:89 (+) Transcript_8188:242-508(+)